jgi:hypothetical protein
MPRSTANLLTAVLMFPVPPINKTFIANSFETEEMKYFL